MGSCGDLSPPLIFTVLKLTPSILHIFFGNSGISRSQGSSRRPVFLEMQGKGDVTLPAILLHTPVHFLVPPPLFLPLRSRCPFSLLRLITHTLGSLVLFLFSDIAQSILSFSPGTSLLHFWPLNFINKVCLCFLFTKKKHLLQFCYQPSKPNLFFYLQFAVKLKKKSNILP